jgi:hypothetical protein
MFVDLQVVVSYSLGNETSVPRDIVARLRALEAGVASPNTDVFVLCNGVLALCGWRGSVGCAVSCLGGFINRVVLYGFWI